MYIRGPRGELKRSRRWGKEVLPPDFSMMDFSDLEEGARKLYHMKDDRMYSDELTPVAAGDSIAVTGQGNLSPNGGRKKSRLLRAELHLLRRIYRVEKQTRTYPSRMHISTLSIIWQKGI